MKLVRGRTLREVLHDLSQGDEETLAEYSLARLLTIFRQVCDAIAFAHHQGVVHRDLKPENIMVGKFGETLVMDWGIAKILGESPATNGEHGDLLREEPVPVGVEFDLVTALTLKVR